MQTNRRGPKKAQMEPKNPMEPKNSTIYTPSIVSKFLYRLLDRPSIQTVLDPALGRGSLTEPWRSSGRTVLGCDIDPDSRPYADRFLLGKFEEVAPWPLARPDLIISNPPLNGHPKKELYPEVFLRHMIHLFGTDLPIVLFTSENLRLNHSLGGTRWRWLRDLACAGAAAWRCPGTSFLGRRSWWKSSSSTCRTSSRSISCPTRRHPSWTRSGRPRHGRSGLRPGADSTCLETVVVALSPSTGRRPSRRSSTPSEDGPARSGAGGERRPCCISDSGRPRLRAAVPTWGMTPFCGRSRRCTCGRSGGGNTSRRQWRKIHRPESPLLPGICPPRASSWRDAALDGEAASRRHRECPAVGRCRCGTRVVADPRPAPGGGWRWAGHGNGDAGSLRAAPFGSLGGRRSGIDSGFHFELAEFDDRGWAVGRVLRRTAIPASAHKG